MNDCGGMCDHLYSLAVFELIEKFFGHVVDLAMGSRYRKFFRDYSASGDGHVGPKTRPSGCDKSCDSTYKRTLTSKT